MILHNFLYPHLSSFVQDVTLYHERNALNGQNTCTSFSGPNSKSCLVIQPEKKKLFHVNFEWHYIHCFHEIFAKILFPVVWQSLAQSRARRDSDLRDKSHETQGKSLATKNCPKTDQIWPKMTNFFTNFN